MTKFPLKYFTLFNPNLNNKGTCWFSINNKKQSYENLINCTIRHFRSCLW